MDVVVFMCVYVCARVRACECARGVRDIERESGWEGSGEDISDR